VVNCLSSAGVVGGLVEDYKLDQRACSVRREGFSKFIQELNRVIVGLQDETEFQVLYKKLCLLINLIESPEDKLQVKGVMAVANANFLIVCNGKGSSLPRVFDQGLLNTGAYSFSSVKLYQEVYVELERWVACAEFGELRGDAVKIIKDKMDKHLYSKHKPIEIVLNGLGLKELPEIFCSPIFKNLRLLSVVDNSLNCLPDLSGLKNMRVLRLTCNNLKFLPDYLIRMMPSSAVFTSGKLMHTEFAFNRITSLPDSILNRSERFVVKVGLFCFESIIFNADFKG
jgi:Leucine-rich repeat (LRR) protein